MECELLCADTELAIPEVQPQPQLGKLDAGHMRVSNLSLRGNLKQNSAPQVVNALMKLALGNPDSFDILPMYQQNLGDIPVR